MDRAVLSKNSEFVEISSAIVRISSELVQISSELVQISSELVLTILELLIISIIKITRKSVLCMLNLFRNEELGECRIFTLIKLVVKSAMSVVSSQCLPVQSVLRLCFVERVGVCVKKIMIRIYKRLLSMLFVTVCKKIARS